MFMLILSVQSFKHIQMVYSSGYTPDLYKSDYVFLSPRYMLAYNFMAKELYKKDSSGLYNSFFWGWVKNPYLDFYRFKKTSDLVGVFIEIPDNRVVVSNYDEYCAYLEEEVDTLSLKSDGACLQGVFRKIKPAEIKSIIKLDTLLRLYRNEVTDLESLYKQSLNKDIKVYTDTFSLPDYSFVLVSAPAS